MNDSERLFQEVQETVGPELNGLRLSRGGRRRVQQMVTSGVDEVEAQRLLLRAATLASDQGRAKIGPFGPPSSAFESMDIAARAALVQAMQEAHRAKAAAERAGGKPPKRKKVRRGRGW